MFCKLWKLQKESQEAKDCGIPTLSTYAGTQTTWLIFFDSTSKADLFFTLSLKLWLAWRFPELLQPLAERKNGRLSYR